MPSRHKAAAIFAAILLLGGVVAYAKVKNAGKAWPGLPPTKTLAVWDWQVAGEPPANLHESPFKRLAKDGINTIYLHIGGVVDIPDSPAGDAQRASYMSNTAAYVSAANTHGLKVQAVAGG